MSDQARTEPAEPLFTHLDARGHARMVDVTAKQPTVRSATATGTVLCGPAVIGALRSGDVPKGDVLAVARIAGIQGAKKTAELLPLAHIIGVHGAVVDLDILDHGVAITATVRTADRTGVEMEALTAVAVAGLAVVDMVKGLDKSVELTDIRLQKKTGGKSGDWLRSPGQRAPDMARVRYFAGAAEAAGVQSEAVPGTTVGELYAAMTALHPALAEILPRCSVLGGRRPDG